MSLVSELTALKNKENTLRGNNAVTPFAYDSEAYNADDADGHADYVSNRHNNIPLADNAVIELNPFVTNKGLRKQASSFTRQLINHFCGRSSYNLNKTTDVVHGALDKLASYVGQPDGLAILDSNGRIPSAQLPEDAVEYKGSWNAQTNSPHLANGTGDKGDMYFVSQAGEQNLWNKLIWNRQFDEFSFRDNIISMCYGNGTWLALDDDSNLHYSNDDFKTKLGGLLASNITDVCFHNGRFFYVRNTSNFVMYFSEALTAGIDVWTAVRNVPIGSLHCIYGDSGVLIAGGVEGIIKSIDNGESWSVVSSTSIKKVAGYNSTWIACKTDGGLIVSSDNGETWADIEGVSSDITFISIFANNGKWIASTEGQGVWQSSDTETWAMLSFIPEKAVCLDVYAYGDIWVISSTGGIDETVSFKGMYISYDNAVTWSEEGAGVNKGITLARSRGDIWLCSSYTEGFDNAIIYKADYYSVTFLEGDEVVYNGSVWERIPVGTVKTINHTSPVNGNMELTGRKLKYVKGDITLEQFTLPFSNYMFNTVYYSDGLWIACSSSHGLWWSTDGKAWTQGTGGTSYTFNTVYYSNGLWIACSSNHGLWWSTDGKAWTQVTGDTSSYRFNAVCYANGIWVAGSDSYGLYWSTDGKNWTQVTAGTSYAFNSVHYANGIWVTGSSSHGLWWSTDGKAWAQGTGGTSYTFNTVYYADNIWVTGSSSHGLWWSTDGKNWAQSTGTTTSYTFYGVHYANGLWVAGSDAHGLWWSTDGKTWTQVTAGTSYAFNSVHYANGIWVAGSSAHGLWWSTDGKAWTQGTGGTSYTFNTVYYADNIWVAGSDVQGLWWSTDGKTWTQVTGYTISYTFYGVSYGNGIWVACCSNGLWWSTDGKTWARGATEVYAFNTVYYSDGIWVAGSDNHGLWWSTDGKTWTQVTGSTTSYAFNAVYYADSVWVAGSYNHGMWYFNAPILNVTMAISYIKSKLGIQ